MSQVFCKFPLYKVTRDLSAVAMGLSPAETVIVNARLVNVATREIEENAGVAVVKGRIAAVGDVRHCIGPETRVIDACGRYLAPGLIDGHIHIESSMLTPCEYARAVIPHGTTAIMPDPHEICNLLGIEGVKFMIEDSKRTPLKAMFTFPSCVPAVEDFEDTGAEITAEDVKQAMQWEEVVGLGEMMNFPGIQYGAEGPHAIVAETLKAGKTVTGHYPSEDARGLNAYLCSGAANCHESVTAEQALLKMRRGMLAFFREGSAWRDLKETANVLKENPTIDTRYASLCSDDTHPETLCSKGHMDHILRRAVEEGIDPLTAIQMTTLNVSANYHLDREMGIVAPGRVADLILIDDLKQFNVSLVLIDGEIVAENGRLLAEVAPPRYERAAVRVMNLDPVKGEDFRIACDKPVQTVRVIEVIGGKSVTRAKTADLTARDGLLHADPARDILKVGVFDRHHNSGRNSFGFVKGFGIGEGAMASTVSHDAHNLIVVGTNDEDMALAANTLIECGGGMAAVKDGKVLAVVPLPIAGLMSDRTAPEMAKVVAALDRAWHDIGCNLPSPFITMALLALACIPELRLTNRGLVDCVRFCFTDLFVGKTDPQN